MVFNNPNYKYMHFISIGILLDNKEDFGVIYTSDFVLFRSPLAGTQ